jgi:hypothetical protein
LEPQHFLCHYIFNRDDFWEEAIFGKIAALEEIFPADITLSHTYLTYKVVYGLNLAHH